MMKSKIVAAVVALAIGAGGIVAGTTAVDAVAAPSTVQQQESVAWLPQPAKRCYWVQVGWAGRYWYCER